MTEYSPLMQQYHNLKNQHPDEILFFRLGDFYEMFDEDARQIAPVLGIALTQRHNIPMCGIPYHAVNQYLVKLIRAGYRVAVSEQLEDPKLVKGLVKRDVVRVITPGMVVEDSLLEDKQNNFLACVYFNPDVTGLGLIFIDISTGDFFGTELTDPTLTQLKLELNRFQPKEILLPETVKDNVLVRNLFKGITVSLKYYIPHRVNVETGKQYLTTQVGITSLKGWGLDDKKMFLSAGAAIFNYIETTQGKIPAQIRKVQYYTNTDYLQLDATALRNLEILENTATRTVENSLLNVIDRTFTPMGGRLLRQWLTCPLTNVNLIRQRQDMVRFFGDNTFLRQVLRDKIKQINDTERLTSRLALGQGTVRELVGINNMLKLVPELKSILNKTQEPDTLFLEGNPVLSLITDQLIEIPELVDLINRSIVDDYLTVPGKIIKPGYSPELDQLRLAIHDGKKWLTDLERKERGRIGINSLKIGFTSVFGYYLEVTKPNLHLVPADYIRKQTLTNSERFVTPELQEKEMLILGAEEKISRLETQLFNEVRDKVFEYLGIIQNNTYTIALLDVYLSLAQVAVENRYIRPEIDESTVLIIKDGKHPVVEKKISSGFVPNDTELDGQGENQIFIITGPNMAGKSTYLRQVALITILAQVGSYVPAAYARIGIVDRIFTRIGSGDNLSTGESTFMVEMQEVANILRNMTPRSLLILDEIGRGTSTYDGISIAWACIEHLATLNSKLEFVSRPRTLFATHYFELTKLTALFPQTKNFNVSVREWGDEIVFLHKIVPGSADRSYGIQVAQLAGLPKEVIVRAKGLLKQWENIVTLPTDVPVKSQDKNIVPENHPVLDEIRNLDINRVTPLDAINLISRWKDKITRALD